MMKLLFGSGNVGKLAEIRQVAPVGIEVIGLDAFPGMPEAPETQPTLEGNAVQKALFYHELTGIACFADDTGLEVDALEGEPGVRSARYAGPEADADANMALVLTKMEHESQRGARFRTVIAFVQSSGIRHVFHGELAGRIAHSRKGLLGFGYDPIFIPINDTRTLAQLSAEEKNLISHRGNAMRQFLAFLNTL